MMIDGSGYVFGYGYGDGYGSGYGWEVVLG